MEHDIIRGGGGGGGGDQHTPVESPDSLHSVAYANILDLVSEGEIVGPADTANPLKCLYFNDTPAMNADGSTNFNNLNIDFRYGTQTQDYIKGFSAVENELSVGVEFTVTSPWEQTISNLELSAVRVMLSVPQLVQTDNTTGDVHGTKVDYKIQIATDGGAFVDKFTGSFNGKTTSKYQRSHRIDLPTATTGWVVRVVRITAQSTSSYLVNATWVESYTEIVDGKYRMPMSALVGTKIDSKQFNTIPSRAFHLKGRIIRVPTNYNPDTRVYTGVWDGTFKLAYTNNPAWVFLDMATNTRYGLGNLVNDSMVDKWTLYTIAQYCDELVDDGFGGQEPRFTANLYLQTQDDALRVMQNIATIFRGIMYAAGSAIIPCADMPADPIYTFTPANVLGGKFVYGGSNRKVRHTVALVSWNDMSDMCRAKVEYVEDKDGIARYGVQPTEVVAIGCTSRGQAHRLGKYLLATERYEDNTVQFGVGLDGAIPAPGKIINVADPLRAGKRMGGRIKSATINTITLDALPTGGLAIGDSVTAITPAGVPNKRTVSGVVGNVVTVSANFDAIPVSQSVWLAEKSSLAAQTFRVLAVTERNDTKDGVGYDITALKHVPGKFDFVELDLKIEEPNITGIIPKFLFAPAGISVSEVHISETNVARKDVHVTWNQVAGAVKYSVAYRMNSGMWISAGVHPEHGIELHNLGAGSLEVMVVAIGPTGVRSQPGVGGPFTITSLSVTPGYVVDLEDQVTAAQIDATNALSTLADIANDNKLTPGEKKVVVKDYNTLINEQAGIDAQATAYSITTEKTAYDNSVTALVAYMATLTTPTLWSVINSTTNIVGTTFRQKFTDVYAARQVLLNKILAVAKQLADTAQTSANAAQTTANTAQTAATNAQTDATNALSQLTDIASDSLLTPGEKPVVIKDRDAITAEQSGIDAQATAFGITTEKTTYDNAVTALTSYLATLTSPTLWSTLTGNTTIVGTTFRQKFTDVYSARQALLNKIYAIAKSLADTAQAAADASSLLSSSAVKPTKQFVFAGASLPAGMTSANWSLASAEGLTSTQLTSTTNDPQLTMGSLNLAPIKCYAVAARVKVVSGTWDGTCYYTNNAHGMQETTKHVVPAPKTGVWTTVVWDMRNLSIGGTDFINSTNIVALRLDLMQSNGAVIEVDWVAYGSFGQVSQGDVDAANAAVVAAQADATSALSKLADITSDNLLTAGEKPIAIKDRDAILAEQSGIDTQATAYNVTTEKTTYDNAVTALTTYLATLTSPKLWSDLTGDTTIVGTTFRQKFIDVYSARTVLLQKIADLVTFGNLAGRGPNLLPDQYSTYEATTLPTFYGPTGMTATRDTVNKLGVDAASLKFVRDTTSPGDVYFCPGAPSTTARNITFDAVGGKKYIVSFLMNPTSAFTLSDLQVQLTDGTNYTPSVPVSLYAGTGAVGSWANRYSALVDCSALAGSFIALRMTLGASTVSKTFNFAQIMVEEAVGVQNKPSVYSRGVTASSVIAANAAANAAQLAANNAQTDATSALNSLTDISNDNLLTPGEKPVAIKDRDAITAEQAGIDAQATDFGIVTEKTTYDNAVTALTSYLATLTSPVLWSTLTGNTTIVGATFRQKFLDVYSARQALLNVIYQAAQNLANSKVAAAGDNLIPNPTFIFNDRGIAANTNVPYAAAFNNICDGWVVTYDGSRTAGQSGTTQQLWHPTARPSQLYVEVHAPVALPTGQLVASQAASERFIPVKELETYLLSYQFVQSFNGSQPANVDMYTRVNIGWYDATGTQIGGFTTFNHGRIAGTQSIAAKSVTAPTGAYSAKIFLDAYVKNNTGANWSHDNTVAMGVAFSYITMVKKMSTTAYLPMLMYVNGRAKVPTVISYTSAAGVPATATINVAAFNVISGSRTISYNAMSVNLSHAAGNVQYFLYFDDPTGAGGSQTLIATTNGDDVYASEGRVYVGDCLVNFPSSGTGGGSGGRQDSCVCIDMFLHNDVLAVEAEAGLVLDCIDLHNLGPVVFKSPMTGVEFDDVPCVELRCRNGAILRCANTTPFDLFDGTTTFAPKMEGQWVLTDEGITDVMQVRDIGVQPVAHIHVHGFSYAAGENPNNRVYSHNPLKP